MLKNMKVAARVSLFICAVLLVGFLILWKAVDVNTSKIVSDNITNQMSDAVKSRSEIIENYVENAEETLVSFGLSEEVVNLLSDPTNIYKQQTAQKYLEEYAAVKGIFEGLYIADYDTQILAHLTTSAIGTYNKKDEASRTSFQETVLAKDEMTDIGILKSPSTGEMVIAAYSPVYKDGKCLGFVGCGVYARTLMDSLLSLKVEGLPNCEYAFLNVSAGTYLYNENPDLLCTETEEQGYIEILGQIRNDNTIDVGVHEYTDSEGVSEMVIYRNFSERGWVFALKDSYDNIYSALGGMKRTTALLCIAVGFVILAVLVIILLGVGKELGVIRRSINKLGEMNLSVDDSLVKYTKRKDEIGDIAKAVTGTCKNLDLYITEVDNQLFAMANGNFCEPMELKFIGRFESVETSMRNIQSALRKSFSEIRTVTSELAIGSNIVADNAVSLADNAVNANQLIMEMGDHVRLLSEQVTNSAKAAMDSKGDMDKTTELVLSSQEKMDELSDSLSKISLAADAIGNISNNMEDIAKQTNILALNALIEATRAGEIGKGFSVVANEIRMLALQSNEAAVNASELITNVIKSIHEGTEIGEETSSYLKNVVAQTKTIDEAISSIATATHEQDESLKAVQTRLRNMSNAIETTAAMAEQSSAASSELDSQIVVLKDGIAKYVV